MVSMVVTARYIVPKHHDSTTTYGSIAAVIRDTLYIDGGALAVSPGLASGDYGELITNGSISSMQLQVL